ncbi:MAG: hypothetical protein F9K45_09235 [Melioribacteraceae bacterium]|nr:MAG: hypothetical protein F9K45_09235 [Melioribacteraceae bacterium]
MQLNLLSIRLYSLLESNKKYLVYFPLYIYWITLFALTSFPTDALPSFGIGDKFEHLIAYFVLIIFMQLTFHFQEKFEKLKKSNQFYAIVISCLYGVFDELHQYFIPGRYCDILDLLANFAGIFIASYLVSSFIKTAISKGELNS